MRILKQLVVSTLLLLAFSFTFTKVHANLQTSLVSVEVVSFFEENNVNSVIVQSQAYGSKLSFASNLVIDPDYAFVFWIVNNVVRPDLSMNNVFTVRENLSIKAIFKPKDQIVAVFQDANGKLIDVQYLSSGQSATAIPDENLPTKPGYVYASPKWDKSLISLTQDTVFTLQYSIDTLSSYTVTVTNGSGAGTYAYNQIATVVANTPSQGIYFDYWKSGDRVVSRSSTYTFTVLGPVSLEAVYSETARVNSPFVSISNDLALRSGYKSYIGQFTLPTGYELIEYGLLTSTSTDTILIGGTGVTKHQANRYLPLTNEYLLSIPTGSIQTARAYMIVEDTSGNFMTVYSQVISTQPAPVYATDLFFSAYLEGSSNNKALAIFNGTGNTVNLTGYTVYLYANGASTPTSTLNLSGNLAHNDVYVIANSAANSTILAMADITSTVTNYNGNDWITLTKNSVVIDSIGKSGTAPSSEWIANGVSTLNQTLLRKQNTLSGDTDPTNAYDPSVYWDSYPQDTTAGLDTFTMAGNSTPLVPIAFDAIMSQTAYFVNGMLNLSGSYLRVFYDNGTSGIVAINSPMITDFTTSTVGTRLLTVTYSGLTDKIRYVVSKAIPTYNVPTPLDVPWTGELTLASITLPSGFAWDTPSLVPSMGENTFTATYTPADTNAFEIVTGIEVSFTVYIPTTPIVIYEVYGGGGNSGSNYTHDYVVLKNNTSTNIDLSTYSLQYGAASGSTYVVLNLVGTIYANSYYLIQLSSGGGGVTALPITPSATGTLALAATAGKIALVSNQIAISSKTSEGVVDFVGYGSANEAETSPTSAPSNTTSVKRSGGDTGNNSADFTVVTPDLSYLTTNVTLVGFGVRNLTTSYDLNAALNVQNAEIVAYYSNGTTQTVALLAGHVSNFSTASLGTFQLNVTYGGIVNQVPYTVQDLSNVSEVKVHYIDIGYSGGGPGESMLIQIGAIDILVDSGVNDSSTQNALLAFLAGNVTDNTIEYIVATHPDADHIGNFIAVMNAYVVSTVIQYSTSSSASTTLRTNYEARIVSEGSTVLYAYALATGGDNTLDIAASIWLEFYDSTYLQSSNTNYSSIIMTLEAFGTRVLFQGDADGNESSYASLVGDIDILKLSHHGSAAGTLSNSLTVWKPEVIIVHNGDYLGNSYSHPTYAALNRVYSYSNNLPVYSVSGGNGSGSDRSLERNGTITVTITTSGYSVVSQHYGINPLELSNTQYWKSSSNPYNTKKYYYASATGITTSSALKAALHNIIKGHTSYTYDAVKTHLQTLDEDPNNTNNVLLFYTGRSQAKSTFGTAVDQWNREHVWAQSHGIDGALPAYTDLHHLRATDVSVNSARGDKDFKNVTHNSSTLVNDTYGSGSSYNYTDGTYFEARNEVKGDVARMMFYMAVRYEGNGEPNLELVNGSTTTSGSTFGDLASLLQWHVYDKVDNAERLRNGKVFILQGNRNPFIDRPEWVTIIFGSAS